MIFRFSLSGMGVLNYENNRISGERYLIRRILLRKIKHDRPVIFDVGANICSQSSSLLDCFPKATIYAFEPHPKNFALLTERVPSSNVKKHNIALGEKSGIITLYDRADCDGSAHASVYEAVISDIHKQEIVAFDVPIKTLDEVAENEGIKYIDYLKIDTEGNELAVLKGASKLLAEGNIGNIHFEFKVPV